MAEHKYLTLDGLRGVAALAVVFWHAQGLGLGHLGSSYLAVDLFFLMSGFVIALSYERKLLDGMSPATFVKIRLKRLYPLYILGTLGLLAYFIAFRFFSDEAAMSTRQLSIASLLGAFYLPMKQTDPTQFIFPLNPPAWSLFYEMVINILYALIVGRLSNRVLIGLVAVSALGLAACAFAYTDLNVGWNWATILGGIPRVSFSFFAGVLLYRYRASLPRMAVPTPVLLLAALALLALPMGGPATKLLTLAIILAGFPLVCAAAIQNEPVKLAGVFAFGGALSYPLYALHHPLITWGYGAAKMIGFSPLQHAWMGWLIMAVVVLGSWVALKIFDEPLRRAMRQRTLKTVAA